MYDYTQVKSFAQGHKAGEQQIECQPRFTIYKQSCMREPLGRPRSHPSHILQSSKKLIYLLSIC